MNRRQVGRKRQLARRVANVHLLGGLSDNPVLGCDVPAREITTVQGGGPLDLLAGGNGDTIEGAQDLWWVIGTAKGDILNQRLE